MSTNNIPLFSISNESGYYDKIMEQIVDVICIFDDQGLFRYISKPGTDLFGYTPEEMLGKHYSEFLLPDDLTSTIHIVQTLPLNQKITHFVNRYVHKNGSIIPVMWSARWNEEDRCCYCVARNHSHINESSSLPLSDNNTKVGICEYDLESNAYTFISENFYEILGIDKKVPPASLKESFWKIVHPDDIPVLKTKAMISINNTDHPSSLALEYRIIRANGQIANISHIREFIYDDKGIAVRYIGTIQDITGFKNAAIIAVQNEEKFRHLVQNGSDLITIIDENCNFLFVSENVRTILGYTPQELIHTNAMNLVHPDDVETASKEHALVLEKRVVASKIKHRFRHKNGDWVWVEAIGSNHLSNPSIHGIVVVSRHIDDQIKLQDQLDKALVSKQREITSAVIEAQEKERRELSLELHDNVNQVLTTVKLYNEMFLSSEGNDKSLLMKSIQYTQACINEIRSISKRLSAPNLNQISFHDSIKELVDSINAANYVEVRLCMNEIEGINISEDLHIAIYRIVQEGLNNILKYSKAQQASIEMTKSDGSLILTIQDNGTGFDTKAKRAGIGITNMKTRAENMNASFRLDTAPGKGCTIEIVFPFDDGISK